MKFLSLRVFFELSFEVFFRLSLKIILLSCFCISLNAAEVLKIKGNKVLIDLQCDYAEKAQLFYLVVDGKKKAIVKIAIAENDKAIGQILKGKAEVGYTLVERPDNPDSFDVASATKTKKKKKSISSESEGGRLSFGLVGGYLINSTSINVANTAQKLSGNSFSFDFLLDFKLTKGLRLTSSLGWSPFAAEQDKNASCFNDPQDATSGLAKCNVDITFVNFDLWARYVIGSSRIKPWVGGGIGYLFPLDTGSTNALSKKSAEESVLTFQGGLGLDFSISKKAQIPFWIEYVYFPQSKNVAINSIGIKTGIVFSF